ncbi:hypothetical protein T07_9555 [Trichinella nelsoni]|uniref:Uncharacterized protein n=1 Tax=Trichinella nelsoni TaxID=6336 RepID=A0A0V0SMS1_9BILA|nr:hypothetical protein T07_9555 [Trichinella nelsoni]
MLSALYAEKQTAWYGGNFYKGCKVRDKQWNSPARSGRIQHAEALFNRPSIKLGYTLKGRIRLFKELMSTLAAI